MSGKGILVGSQGQAVESAYGEPYIRTAGYQYGAEPAPWSGMPYIGDEDALHSSCSATTKKGTLCKAPKAKGTDMCIGHLKAAQSASS